MSGYEGFEDRRNKMKEEQAAWSEERKKEQDEDWNKANQRHEQASKEMTAEFNAHYATVHWYASTWFIVVCCLIGLAIIASIVGGVVACVCIGRSSRPGGGKDPKKLEESGKSEQATDF